MMQAAGIRSLVLVVLCLILGACSRGNDVRPGDDPLGLDPEDSPAELYVRMAEEYYKRGQMDVAFRRAQQAIQTDKRYPRAHIWMAFLYEQVGQGTRAASHYERAILLAPNNAEVLHAYGSYLCRQGQYAKADAQFAKALDNPIYATPWVTMTNAGDCAESAGDARKAEDYYRAAVAANPSFGPAIAKLAELEYRRGDLKAAKGYVDRYFEPETLRAPSSSREALAAGARIERQLGNRKRAAYYEKLLRENFPSAPEP